MTMTRISLFGLNWLYCLRSNTYYLELKNGLVRVRYSTIEKMIENWQLKQATLILPRYMRG